MVMGSKSPFADFLEERPEIGFQGFLENRGFNRSKRNQLSNMFNRFQSDFLGKLANQIIQGETPNLRFMDYLQDDSNIDRIYGASSPRGRGMYQGYFTPRVRHLYGRF